MAHFVVAVEFDGADLPAIVGGARTPLREHAFDIETGELAHGGENIRVGFPEPRRGWTAVRTSLSCPRCDSTVNRFVSTRIGMVLDEVTTRPPVARRGDLTNHWVWLYPPDLP